MNTVVIGLGIVIVFLIYILYSYFSNLSKTLNPSASLTSTVPAIDKINNPNSTRYAYGTWIFVNSWDASVAHTIFFRDRNLNLYIDNTPSLKLQVFIGSESSGKWSEPLNVTNNFPLQKWVHLIVSMDNEFADIYMDGKLVKSHKFIEGDKRPAIPPKNSSTYPVYLGNPPAVTSSPAQNPRGQTYDAYVTKFKRWADAPVDPQTAWNTYMEGNGSSSLLGSLGAYGVNLTLLKNNVENSKLVLF
jgi:hypothetical protein